MEHTSKQFEIELEDLRSGLLAMGGLVEAQFERALEAIASGDEELVEVVLREEKRVNDKQIELDRKSVEIIAKRQPAAVPSFTTGGSSRFSSTVRLEKIPRSSGQ